MKTFWVLGLIFLLVGCSEYTQQYPIDTLSLSWVPPLLRGAKCFYAPKGLADFAIANGANHVIFVDDQQKCDRSICQNRDIFVNSRVTYWATYMLPPWLCQCPAEVILQRTLHEIGHIVLQHPGNPDIISTAEGLVLPKSDNPWDALRGSEEQAWKFVFLIRDSRKVIYASMLDEVNDWYYTHTYRVKDWYDDGEKQWLSIYKKPYPDYPWTLAPEWVRTEFLKPKENEIIPKNTMNVSSQ